MSVLARVVEMEADAIMKKLVEAEVKAKAVKKKKSMEAEAEAEAIKNCRFQTLWFPSYYYNLHENNDFPWFFYKSVTNGRTNGRTDPLRI